MKILIYSINFWPELTGIGKYTGEMARWLAGRGHSVSVVTAPPYYPQWKIQQTYSSWKYRREHLEGVDIIRCPLWVPKKLTAATRIFHLTSFAFTSFPVLLWTFLKRRPDIVFVLEPPFLGVPFALATARLMRVKAWLHVQDFELDAAFELRLLRGKWLKRCASFVERFLSCRFDVVSSISEQMVERLGDKGVKRDNTFLFLNWVDTTFIYPTVNSNGFRRKLGLSAEDIVVLYSGNMGRKQGLEIVIEAAGALADHVDIHFVLCGDGSMRPELEGLAAQRRNIHWLPLQPDDRFNELLNLADIHLLTQRSGAGLCFMPSKLTAMMANGKPIIATAEPSSPVAQIVQKCGEVVPPGDLSSLVQAVVALALDTSRRLHLGEVAREHAVRHWHKENILLSFEERLQSCLSEKT